MESTSGSIVRLQTSNGLCEPLELFSMDIETSPARYHLKAIIERAIVLQTSVAITLVNSDSIKQSHSVILPFTRANFHLQLQTH